MKRIIILLLTIAFVSSCETNTPDHQVYYNGKDSAVKVIYVDNNNNRHEFFMEYLLFTQLYRNGGYGNCYNYYNSHPAIHYHYRYDNYHPRYRHYDEPRVRYTPTRSSTPPRPVYRNSTTTRPAIYRSSTPSSSTYRSTTPTRSSTPSTYRSTTPTRSSSSTYRSTPTYRSSSTFRSSSPRSSSYHH